MFIDFIYHSKTYSLHSNPTKNFCDYLKYILFHPLRFCPCGISHHHPRDHHPKTSEVYPHLGAPQGKDNKEPCNEIGPICCMPKIVRRWFHHTQSRPCISQAYLTRTVKLFHELKNYQSSSSNIHHV